MIKGILQKSLKEKCWVLIQQHAQRVNKAKFADREQFLKSMGDWFFKSTGEELDLNNPVTFNQKTQWLKVFDSTEMKGRLADKYLVRQFIEETIGSDYLVPLLGVYESVDDVDFNALPDRFILKATHGSGWNIVVPDKAKLSISEAKWKLKKWLKMDFSYLHGYELHYRYCQPRVIAEEYLDDLSSGSVDDYKVYCFNNGEPIVLVCGDRYSEKGMKTAYYDSNWNKLFKDACEETCDFKRPPHLDEMIRMSEKLAQGFAFVRVDWYESTRGLLFGEMTFTSASGTEEFDPPEWNRIMGDRIDLNQIACE